jgi:hypothetical protein
MKHDESFYKMIKDLQAQNEYLRNLYSVHTAPFDHIAQSVAEQERLIRGIQNRYQGIGELAQREAARYKDLFAQSEHLAGVITAASFATDYVKDYESLTKMAAEAIGRSKYWHTELERYRGFAAESEACRLALQSHYADVAELALIAQEQIKNLQWDRVGLALKISPQEISSAASYFSEMMKSYELLFRSFGNAEYRMASYPPFMSKLPPIEIIKGSDVFGIISEEDWQETTEEGKDIQGRLDEDIETSLGELLNEIAPDIVPLWEGAEEALRSDNPERKRHVIVSLRELVTQVLHRVAPDSDIQLWTRDKVHYHDGRPTRKPRLLFICRNLNHGPFQRFVELDVAAHIELIGILQRGTHEVDIQFTNDQLKALLLQTESLMRFILVIWESGRGNTTQVQ